jgi:hypothetical protein
MGSALLTSILGWLFGGELSTRSATREDDMLRAEATKVVEELRGFASGVRGAHEDYIRGVKGLLVGHEELEKKQREARERAIRTALELDEHIVSVGKQFEDLRSSLDDTVKTLRDKLGHEFRKEVAAVPTALGEVNTALRNVAESAKDTAKYLNESRLLIDQLEKLTDTIAGLRA